LDLSQWSTSTILHKAKDIAENNLGSHALTLCVETMLPLCDGGAHNEGKDQENKRVSEMKRIRWTLYKFWRHISTKWDVLSN